MLCSRHHILTHFLVLILIFQLSNLPFSLCIYIHLGLGLGCLSLQVGLCLGSKLESLALPGSSITEASLLGLLPRLTSLRRLDLRGLDSLFMSGALLSREEHRQQVFIPPSSKGFSNLGFIVGWATEELERLYWCMKELFHKASDTIKSVSESQSLAPDGLDHFPAACLTFVEMSLALNCKQHWSVICAALLWLSLALFLQPDFDCLLFVNNRGFR